MLWCRWNGAKLAANWSACETEELCNHTADTALYDVESNGESVNVAGRVATGPSKHLCETCSAQCLNAI